LIVESAARIVREDIFEAFVGGMSQRGIARALADNGAATAYGGQWRQATIRLILQNVLYTGRIRHRGHVYDGEHEAIMTEDLFDAAQARMLATARTTGHGGGRWPRGSHVCTKGLLRCGQCGSALIPRTDTTRERAGEWYVCDGRLRRGAWFCSQPFIRRAVIDDALLSELNVRYLDREAMLERMRARLESDKETAAIALADAERDALKAAERLARVTRGWQDGVIDDDEYRRQRTGLLEERQAATAAVECARDRQAKVAEARPLDAEEALLRRLADLRAAVVDGIGKAPDLNGLRRLLQELFVKIELIRWPGFGTTTPGLAPASETPTVEHGGATYVLLPHVRNEALDSCRMLSRAELRFDEQLPSKGLVT